MALCITLLFAAIAVSAGMTTTNGCSDKYTNQPPNELNCNPLHTTVTLQCATDSNSHEVTWYWTQNFSDAGIRGEEILPGSTGYTVSVFGAHLKHLTFVVMNSSLGYYWCEISNAVNASLRSSTITPVCAQQTLSKCNESYVFGIHHIGEECAMENSPLVFNRPPLPKCFPQTEQADIVSSNSIHDFYPTTTQAKLISSSLVPLESFTSTPALDTVIFTTTSPYQASTETLVSHPTTETPTARPTAASAVFPLFWVLVVVLGMLLFAVFGLSVIAITVLVIFKKKISLRKFGKEKTVVAVNPRYDDDSHVNGETTMVMSENQAYSSVTQHRSLCREHTYEQPDYEQPNYKQPTYEQPTYEQPTYEQPTCKQPTYEQPTFEPYYEPMI